MPVHAHFGLWRRINYKWTDVQSNHVASQVEQCAMPCWSRTLDWKSTANIHSEQRHHERQRHGKLYHHGTVALEQIVRESVRYRRFWDIKQFLARVWHSMPQGSSVDSILCYLGDSYICGDVPLEKVKVSIQMVFSRKNDSICPQRELHWALQTLGREDAEDSLYDYGWWPRFAHQGKFQSIVVSHPRPRSPQDSRNHVRKTR